MLIGHYHVYQVPRAEYVEQLQMLMEPVTSPGLFAKIFHADFKQHIEALKILTGDSLWTLGFVGTYYLAPK